MRCGSLGLTSFAINMIQQSIFVIITITMLCYIGRACISATRRISGWIVAWEVAWAGLLLWLPGLLAGAGMFAVMLM